MKVINQDIKRALSSKGYRWGQIDIRPVWGHTNKFDVYLDQKFVEQYDAKRKRFFE